MTEEILLRGKMRDAERPCDLEPRAQSWGHFVILLAGTICKDHWRKEKKKRKKENQKSPYGVQEIVVMYKTRNVCRNNWLYD